MPKDAALLVVDSSAERVLESVERVCDWETARVRFCGILELGDDSLLAHPRVTYVHEKTTKSLTTLFALQLRAPPPLDFSPSLGVDLWLYY
jgi:hypothetical protein